MGVTAAVFIEAYDVALRVDRFRIRPKRPGSRKIDGRKGILAQQISMSVGAGIKIVPHDVASRIDPARDGENGSRYIDRGKRTVAQQITMTVAAGVKIEPYNFALRIDPGRDRE